ncbi:hypothetical protein [Streptomyces virginiae]|uniref:hypothetical protein n=1 Tax=Streptomyces virginiae TaxID=1961 RepID=UPI0037016252
MVRQEGRRAGRRTGPKAASGAAVDVRVAGGPGKGLTVDVRNSRPSAQHAAPVVGGTGPGGGQGLTGPAERARLAGGELTALPEDGGFRVRPWRHRGRLPKCGK